MLTPKEKHVQSQTISTKRNKFFRLLQSSSNVSDYCLTASEQLLLSIKEKIEKLVDDKRVQTSARVDSTNQNDDDKKQENDKSTRRRERDLRRKVVKLNGAIFGLNQTLKSLQNNRSVMVWVDKNIAPSLLNVIHKLCSNNSIWCFDMDLTGYKTLFNLSTLLVVSFDHSVAEEQSELNQVYKSMIVFANSETKPLPKSDPKIASQSCSGKCVPPKLADYFLPRSADSYRSLIEKHLCNKKIADNEFIDNVSFVSLARTSQYFPDYQQKQSVRLIEITVNDKPSEKDKAINANRFAQELFEFDKIAGEQEKLLAKQEKFKPPKLMKGQMESKKNKRKKKENKFKPRKLLKQ